MKKIIIDMDGVICDFVGEFKRRVELRGYRFSQTMSYNLAESIIGCDLENAEEIKEEIFQDDSFWLNIPIMDEDAVSVLSNLCGVYDVAIVTTSYPLKENCVALKIEWIKKNLPSFPLDKVVFAEEKWKIEADCIIEDNPIQIRNFNGVTVCFEAMYNISVDTHYRVTTWHEIDKLFFTHKILDKDHGEKGVKFNYDKLKWSLADFEALEPMIQVLDHGAKKYSEDNWKNVSPYEYVDSLLRHVTEFSDIVKARRKKIEADGEIFSTIADHDSKLRTIGHILCNAMFLSYFEKQGKI